MGLSERCAWDFSPRDWKRGTEYFKSGAVHILNVSDTLLDAEVQGSDPEPYQVSLDWSEAAQGILLADCSCPRFEDAGKCKHWPL